MLNKNNFLSGTVDRLEENKAVIKFSDGQSLNVPIAYLPEGVAEGEVLKIIFRDDAHETKNKENQAKSMLNEILKINE